MNGKKLIVTILVIVGIMMISGFILNKWSFNNLPWIWHDIFWYILYAVFAIILMIIVLVLDKHEGVM